MSTRYEVGPLPLDTSPDQQPFAVAAELRRAGQQMWTSAIIEAAAELRLADLIDEEPAGYREVAVKAGADPDAMLRLLRALAAHGIFAPAGADAFVHTPASRMLRTQEPGSVLNLSLLGAAQWNWAIWSRLTDSVRTGTPVFPALFGKDLYRYFAEDNPRAGAIFNRAMAESGQWTSGPIAHALDLTGAGVVADIGGGHGGLLRLLLERHPHVVGILVDSASVLAQADPELSGGELAGRSALVPADIRESVPAVADVYVLRQVMHIWTDEECVRILRNVAAAARPGARIVLAEHVMADDGQRDSTYTTLIDLQMMLLGLGRERTGSEFAALMQAAGLEFSGTTPLSAPLQLVEGRAPR
ncbi:MAG TPA: methyltransferase [Streptosporangiaceae bacterium]|nr:methyltransferase [Streptosporangiaceae bacterium]